MDLATSFADYFIEKISLIREKLQNYEIFEPVQNEIMLQKEYLHAMS